MLYWKRYCLYENNTHQQQIFGDENFGYLGIEQEKNKLKMIHSEIYIVKLVRFGAD